VSRVQGSGFKMYFLKSCFHIITHTYTTMYFSLMRWMMGEGI
jgi:hypothetical protein